MTAPDTAATGPAQYRACRHCEAEIVAAESSPTGFTHIPRGGKAGGDYCNPEFTRDNEQTMAEPDA